MLQDMVKVKFGNIKKLSQVKKLSMGVQSVSPTKKLWQEVNFGRFQCTGSSFVYQLEILKCNVPWILYLERLFTKGKLSYKVKYDRFQPTSSSLVYLCEHL